VAKKLKLTKYEVGFRCVYPIKPTEIGGCVQVYEP